MGARVELSSHMSKQKVSAILWDIDGTLFSSEEILAEAYEKAFLSFQKLKPRRSYLSPPTLEKIMPEIGKPVKVIFQNLVPELNQDEQDELSLGVLYQLVLMIMQGKGHFYPDVKEVLQKLYERGIRFFTASNGRYPYIETILRRGEVLPFFIELDTIDNKFVHNKTQLVAHILHKYKLEPKETVLVGDRKSDSDAAKENEIGFIATSFGHGESTEWKDPLAVIGNLKALLHVI